MKPVVISLDDNHTEEWNGYKCKLASAKRLTVNLVKTIVMKDAAMMGITIANTSATELVAMLEHFAENSELEEFVNE